MRNLVCSLCGFLLFAVIAHSPRAVSQPDKNSAKPKVTDSIGTNLVLLHHGEFEMGSEETFSEEPMHHVTLTKDFYLAAEPVTIAQFKKFVKETGYKTEAEANGNGCSGYDAASHWFATKPEFTWRNPGFEQADDHPVVCVSWNDATAFVDWLSKKEKKHYRLPTEAEMEYAQRAGTATRFPGGDAAEGLRGYDNIADQSLDKVTEGKASAVNRVPKGYEAGVGDWNDGYPFTSPVAKFKANQWGLYDMNGDVWTWCSDWTAMYKAGSQVDPQGPPESLPATMNRGRAARGGAWFVGPWRCRSNARMNRNPDESLSYIGIRVARDAS